MIEFPPDIPNEEMLLKTVRNSLDEKNPIPTLSELFPKKSFEELRDLAREWQRLGFGSLTETRSDGVWTASFTVNDAAVAHFRAAEDRKLVSRIKRITLAEWVQIGILVAVSGTLVVSIMQFTRSAN